MLVHTFVSFPQKAGLIAGSVIGIIVLAAVIAIVVYFVKRKMLHKQQRVEREGKLIIVPDTSYMKDSQGLEDENLDKKVRGPLVRRSRAARV